MDSSSSRWPNFYRSQRRATQLALARLVARGITIVTNMTPEQLEADRKDELLERSFSRLTHQLR